jgi:putative ABC transport system ATP-binding protein
MNTPSASQPAQTGDSSEPMIRLRNIEKCYQTKAGFTYVLRQINLDIGEGDFVTIMGPSGAGKSTLLGILGFYDHGWEGEFQFLGHPVHRLSSKDRAALNKRHVGFVFQQFHLLDDLTVAENLDMPLSYRNIPKSERQSAVADVLDRFNIVGKKDLFPSQLSGGQQQLVAVARAVIAKPQIILADEPTGNLHTDQGREIMELFKKLNQQGTTIVQVTHNEAWAAYARMIVRLKDGWMEKQT